MTSHHVIKVDIVGHGPELDADSSDRGHPERLWVEKVIRVRDLARLPLALVVGVIDEGCVPFTLVQRVVDHRRVPLAASWG